MKKISFWFWAVYLVGAFAVSWIVIGWIHYSTGCDFSKHPQQTQTCKLLKAFFDWQNAYGGIAAVCAAFIGGRYILRQIEQTRDLVEDRRRREERAAVAVLPLALSELSQYARDCIRLLALYLHTGNPAVIPPNVEAPRVPPNTVEALQLCARHANPENLDKIAKALGKLQVQQSRLRNWLREVREQGGQVSPIRRIEGIGYMRDAADLHAAIDDLFVYSRDEDLVRRRATQQQLTSALHNSGIWDDSHPIWELIRPPAPPA